MAHGFGPVMQKHFAECQRPRKPGRGRAADVSTSFPLAVASWAASGSQERVGAATEVDGVLGSLRAVPVCQSVQEYSRISQPPWPRWCYQLHCTPDVGACEGACPWGSNVGLLALETPWGGCPAPHSSLACFPSQLVLLLGDLIHKRDSHAP